MIKPIRTTCEMRAELGKLKSYWSNESLLNTKMLLWICERIDDGTLGVRRRKRAASPYNKFVGQQLKAGKSWKEATESWQAQKKGAKK